MDENTKHRVSMGTGTFLGVASMVLPTLWPDMPKLVAWAGLFMGLGFLAWGFWPLAKAWTEARRKPPVQPTEWVPMQEAARLALEVIDGSVQAMAARRMSNAPRGPICYMAEALLMEKLPLYGRRTPSSPVALVPGDLLDCSMVADQGATARDRLSKDVGYTDLQVKQDELAAVLERLGRKV